MRWGLDLFGHKILKRFSVHTMVVSARTKARFKALLTIISQNCQGLKTEARLDEVISVLSSRDAFLA